MPAEWAGAGRRGGAQLSRAYVTSRSAHRPARSRAWLLPQLPAQPGPPRRGLVPPRAAARRPSPRLAAPCRGSAGLSAPRSPPYLSLHFSPRLKGQEKLRLHSSNFETCPGLLEDVERKAACPPSPPKPPGIGGLAERPGARRPTLLVLCLPCVSFLVSFINVPSLPQARRTWSRSPPPSGQGGPLQPPRSQGGRAGLPRTNLASWAGLGVGRLTSPLQRILPVGIANSWKYCRLERVLLNGSWGSRRTGEGSSLWREGEGAATEPDSDPQPGWGLRVPPSQHVTRVLSHCRQLAEVFAVSPTAAPAQN